MWSVFARRWIRLVDFVAEMWVVFVRRWLGLVDLAGGVGGVLVRGCGVGGCLSAGGG